METKKQCNKMSENNNVDFIYPDAKEKIGGSFFKATVSINKCHSLNKVCKLISLIDNLI